MIVGILRGDNDTVRVVVPAEGFTVQDNFDQINEYGFEMDSSGLPDSRVFRDAWVINQIENGVVVDLDRAKLLAIRKLENIVSGQLKAIRPLWEEAFDNDDTILMNQIKIDRADIRDELSDTIADINAATTVAEVESYLP